MHLIPEMVYRETIEGPGADSRYGKSLRPHAPHLPLLLRFRMIPPTYRHRRHSVKAGSPLGEK